MTQRPKQGSSNLAVLLRRVLRRDEHQAKEVDHEAKPEEDKHIIYYPHNQVLTEAGLEHATGVKSIPVALCHIRRSNKMLRQDDFQKSQLVLTGWRHGKDYGGHLASCMIMSCVMNRVRAGWGGLLDQIDRIPMYAATAELPPVSTPPIWEPQFIRLLHEVDSIFDGTADYSKGGLYWTDLRYVDTPFFKNKILGDPEHHPKVADMNSLAFYR